MKRRTFLQWLGLAPAVAADPERDEWYRERVGMVPAWSDRVTDTPERRELAEMVARGESIILPCPLPSLSFTVPGLPALPPLPFPTLTIPGPKK